MTETVNETKPEKAKTENRKRFSLLVFLASVLSLGSLIWTTYSLLDFFQDGGIDPATFDWKDVSIVGLSAAATADIGWSLTMAAEYRGTRIMARKKWGKKQFEVNILPAIGWIEVLFVAALLFAHGKTVGGGEAAFAAVLPILAKFSWMVALADLKDPSELTIEEKQEIAEMERESRRTKAKLEATAKQHEAEMEQKRRENEAKLEDKKLTNEMMLLDREADFGIKELELRQENRLKALTETLKTELQISHLNNRMQVDLMRDEHDREMSLRRPRTIPGQVIPQRGLAQSFSMLEIESTRQGQDVEPDFLDLAKLGLTPAEQRRAQMAHDYYTADALHNGTVTKAAFAKANQINPPRVTEATKDFPAEWFVERGLATWMSTQD